MASYRMGILEGKTLAVYFFRLGPRRFVPPTQLASLTYPKAHCLAAIREQLIQIPLSRPRQSLDHSLGCLALDTDRGLMRGAGEPDFLEVISDGWLRALSVLSVWQSIDAECLPTASSEKLGRQFVPLRGHSLLDLRVLAPSWLEAEPRLVWPPTWGIFWGAFNLRACSNELGKCFSYHVLLAGSLFILLSGFRRLRNPCGVFFRNRVIHWGGRGGFFGDLLLFEIRRLKVSLLWSVILNVPPRGRRIPRGL